MSRIVEAAVEAADKAAVIRDVYDENLRIENTEAMLLAAIRAAVTAHGLDAEGLIYCAYGLRLHADHAREMLEYSSMVGIPIDNAAEMRAEVDVKDAGFHLLRDLAALLEPGA